MGKRIIQQRRGRGTQPYKVNKKSYQYKLRFPKTIEEGKVVKLINSKAHTAPIAEVETKSGNYFVPAFKGMMEGQKINENYEAKPGNILKLKDIPLKTKIHCIESKPQDGGKFIKTGGSSAVINRIVGGNILVMMPSKKEKKLNPESRAIIGEVAGHGRLEKPIVKAGKNYYIKKSKGKLWPRTSALKMNALDHPFGCGRAKNPKSKVAKRNVPAGKKVGLIRPKRTGKK